MPDLSSNSRKELLELAHKAIRTRLETGDILKYTPGNPELLLRRGCFVTLRLAGNLRGCVGTFEATEPLYQNVILMAVASAFQDSRFSPVQKSELESLEIQISVLGELCEMKSIQELEIGRHGVYVRLGERSGTFLPEVAVEQKWRPEEFIIYCAKEKAGLVPEECARAQVFLYEVEKF